MTKDFKRQQARIRVLVARWFPLLGLHGWEIDVRIDRATYAGDAPQAGWIGEACVHWEYQKGVIRFFLDTMNDLTDAQLERAFVHECCHVLVNEMREWSAEHDTNGAVKHEERVVTALTNAFLWTREAKE